MPRSRVPSPVQNTSCRAVACPLPFLPNADVVQNMSCRAVACPLPSLPNADVLQHAGAGAGGNVSLHGEGVTIRCKAGFKLSGSKSVFSAPCSNASYAMCLDGALMFGAVSDGDASAYSSTTPPTCVPILGCASTAEVCGMEGCAPPPPTAVADPNAIYNASASVAHTASLTVTCKAGYAAVARADVRAGTCDDAGEYQIGCKYCTYAAPEMECRRIQSIWGAAQDPNGQNVSRIQCIWGAAQDPNGQNASSSALALQTVQITCNEGFKVSAGVSAAPTDAASYLATCSMPALPNARQVEASASGGFAHGDVLGFQCNTSYAASVLPGGGASCADTAYAFCHGGSLFWGAARDTSPLLRTPYTPSGALPLCVAKTCPVLSAVDHPNAVIPAPEVSTDLPNAVIPAPEDSTGAYPYPNGASSRNLTLQCLPGFRAGPSPAISESPMSYTLQCASCAWLASESGDAATGNSSNAGGDTTSDASPQDTTQDATPQTTAARRLLQEDNGENPWNRCAPARCTPFDSSAPPSSIASIYGIASEVTSLVASGGLPYLTSDATSLVASDGLPYLDTTEVVCAEGFRIKGNNGVRQARVRCTDAGYAPLTLSGIVAAGMEAVDELSAVMRRTP
ncbi:hypothetical protein T484DRAFT_1806158 [Baffinella frigidus]|nr:hypothetical protein T484DRAFT_1806158 [Cryptophyta sp. CCMP2293]